MNRKRKFAAQALSVLMLAFVLVLTACGASSTTPTANETGQETTAESETNVSDKQVDEVENTDRDTRTIATVTGDLEIPVQPKRIVVDGYLPNLLALGVKPVGATSWDLENKVIADRIEGITSTGERSPESVLALEPDLIITWVNPDSDGPIIEQYNKIAPTLALPYGHFKDTYEAMRYFGQLLGKEEEAEAWLADLDQVSADAREAIKPYVKETDTAALMGVFVVDKNFYIYGDGAYRGGEALYQHVKLTPPAKQREEMIGKETYKQVSYEVIGDYAGDFIFLDQGDMLPEIWGSNDGIWKTLDAVKNDRVFQLDSDLFWGNDPISLKLQIKEIANMIVERERAKQE
ncbi:ABC transporter substrate-binding protein [Saccharibacillus sacchari]|uniref:ABC transporter substrate-binding protein n=1 Tax=Saccharibacillus sacchari TaxID=456493 RepID=A0ACC6PEG6_9BACL